MKKGIIALFAIVFAFEAYAFQVTITGEIKNATQKNITLYFLNDPVVGKPIKEPIASGVTEGKFKLTFDIQKNRNAFLRYGQHVAQMYLTEGADVKISFDEQDFQNTLEYEGEGSGPNRFISAFGKEFTERNKKMYMVKRKSLMNDSLSFEAYVKLEKAFMEDRIKFVKKNRKKYDLPKTFANMLIADIKYGSIKALFHLATQKSLAYNDKGYAFVEWVELDDEEAGELSSNYHEVLKQYFQFQYMKEKDIRQITDKYFLVHMYNEGAENLSGNAKDVFLSSTMHPVLVNKWGFLIDSLYPRYKEDVQSEYYKNVMEEKYQAYIKEKNMPLPDGAEILENPFNNIEEIFAQYKGKVIYVDVWASWCGPCKREMPHSMKLQEKMKDRDDVVFLFVDVNDKQPNWKKAIKALGITGKHVSCSQQQSAAFMNKYGIRGIPRYMIVNKKGEIVDENAPRPSWENAEQAIRKHL